MFDLFNDELSDGLNISLNPDGDRVRVYDELGGLVYSSPDGSSLQNAVLSSSSNVLLLQVKKSDYDSVLIAIKRLDDALKVIKFDFPEEKRSRWIYRLLDVSDSGDICELFVANSSIKSDGDLWPYYTKEVWSLSSGKLIRRVTTLSRY